jgi:hypothetical protein
MDCIQNDESNNSSVVVYVFVAMETFLPSISLATAGWIHIQIHRLMGWMYEVCRWNGLRCHDMHTKFRKDWLSQSKIVMGDTQTHRQHEDREGLLLFFQSKEIRLLRSPCCLCVCVFLAAISFWMPEPIFMKLGMYIMTPELISTDYFIHPFHQSVCLCFPLSLLGKGSVNTFSRQRIHETQNCWTSRFLCGSCHIKVK